MGGKKEKEKKGREKKKSQASCVGVMSHKCNPIYLGGRDVGGGMNLRLAWGNTERIFTNTCWVEILGIR